MILVSKFGKFPGTSPASNITVPERTDAAGTRASWSRFGCTSPWQVKSVIHWAGPSLTGADRQPAATPSIFQIIKLIKLVKRHFHGRGIIRSMDGLLFFEGDPPLATNALSMQIITVWHSVVEETPLSGCLFARFFSGDSPMLCVAEARRFVSPGISASFVSAFCSPSGEASVIWLSRILGGNFSRLFFGRYGSTDSID